MSVPDLKKYTPDFVEEHRDELAARYARRFEHVAGKRLVEDCSNAMFDFPGALGVDRRDLLA